MILRTTFLIQSLVVFFIAAGFLLLLNDLRKDLHFQSFQAAELVMIDTANILAAELETRSQDGVLDTTSLQSTLAAASQRHFEADVFHQMITGVDLGIYVTDIQGKVLFDSNFPANIGQDFSKKRDVSLTLAGKYGARSSRLEPNNPASSVLHVAAPIYGSDSVSGRKNIIGCLTVRKAQKQFRPFILERSKNMVWSATLIGSGVIVLAIAVFFWLLRPIRRLTAYAQAIKDGKRVSLPWLGQSREARTLGAAMEEMREQLEGRAYAEKYVSTLSHELKSPITAIRGAAELLQEEMPDTDRRRFLSNILQEADRSESLIRHMLALSKIEGQTTNQRKEVIIPLEILHSAVAEKRSRAEAARVRIAVCETENPPATSGDRFAVRTALLNMLENAIDHAPKDSEIVCRVYSKNGQIVFSIQDHGPGVPDYAQGRIFEHFYSLRHLHTGKKGTGLGLTYVREAAHLHHGTADLKNLPTGGCQATFSIAEVATPE